MNSHDSPDNGGYPTAGTTRVAAALAAALRAYTEADAAQPAPAPAAPAALAALLRPGPGEEARQDRCPRRPCCPCQIPPAPPTPGRLPRARPGRRLPGRAARTKHTLVEESFGLTSQGYQLTQAHRVGGHAIRVRVRRDFYQARSFALAEVLNHALTWTPLASQPPAAWHQGTPARSAAAAPLTPIAAALLDRARAILGI
jgi:hypothetical protein